MARKKRAMKRKKLFTEMVTQARLVPVFRNKGKVAAPAGGGSDEKG